MVTRERIQSLNPATEEVLATFSQAMPGQVEEALATASQAYRRWRTTSVTKRAGLLQQAATYLRAHKARLAGLITAEMGKPITEAEAEVEKCAWNCVFYAEHGETMLQMQHYPSQAQESYVEFTPLGTVLAIMPWNYPLWQVFRFAAPALLAGNTALLKH